jgi:hypothetical protein
MAVFPTEPGIRGHIPDKNRVWGLNFPHGDSGAGTR